MNTDNLYPFILWSGVDEHGHAFRLVDRGPAREGKHEPQFIFERGAGRDGMFQRRWLPINKEFYVDALETIVPILGRLLGTQPDSFAAGHRLGCELNSAITDSRESRGCDCKDFLMGKMALEEGCI